MMKKKTTAAGSTTKQINCRDATVATAAAAGRYDGDDIQRWYFYVTSKEVQSPGRFGAGLNFF